MKTPEEYAMDLLSYDDNESRIAIYKELGGLVKQLEEIQKTAKRQIEAAMQATGEVSVTTRAGKASYTVPKTPRLDRTAWKRALAERQDLFALDALYKSEQESYKKLPPPSLRIT